MEKNKLNKKKLLSNLRGVSLAASLGLASLSYSLTPANDVSEKKTFKVGEPLERLYIGNLYGEQYRFTAWDHTANEWVNYNKGQFETPTGRTHDFQVPSWNHWYLIRVRDIEKDEWVYTKWVGHFILGEDNNFQEPELINSEFTAKAIPASFEPVHYEKNTPLEYNLYPTGNNPYAKNNLEEIISCSSQLTEFDSGDPPKEYNSLHSTVNFEVKGLEQDQKGRYYIQAFSNGELINSIPLIQYPVPPDTIRVETYSSLMIGFEDSGRNSQGDKLSFFLLDKKKGELYDTGNEFNISRNNPHIFLNDPVRSERLVASKSTFFEGLSDAVARLVWGIPVDSDEVPQIYLGPPIENYQKNHLNTNKVPLKLTWNGNQEYAKIIYAKKDLMDPEWIEIQRGVKGQYFIPTDFDQLFLKVVSDDIDVLE